LGGWCPFALAGEGCVFGAIDDDVGRILDTGSDWIGREAGGDDDCFSTVAEPFSASFRASAASSNLSTSCSLIRGLIGLNADLIGAVICGQSRLREDPSLRAFNSQLTALASERLFRMNNELPISNTKAAQDQVRIQFDCHCQSDGKVLFEFRIKQLGRKSHIGAPIDLWRLNKKQQLRLNEFLERLHTEQTLLVERVRTISWLVDISLTQERPELTKAERDTEIRRLLLCESELTAKEAVFEVRDQTFLQSSESLKAFIEETKRLRGYPEVRRAWCSVVRAFNIGTPKFIEASPKEQDEFELFFIRLRHESMATAFSMHAALVDKWTSNQIFRSAVSEVLERPLTVESLERRLEYYILCGWITTGLWLLNYEDRATMLRDVYGITLVSGEGVRKAIGRLPGVLKDWNDFQPKGTKAPFYVETWNEGQQQWCHILPQN
jgi:hypothetical protein